MASEYFYASTLNQLFRDKDTGEPLVGGHIFFWKDQSKTESKTVYKLSGSPGNYSYVPYQTNPDGSIPINSYGTLEDALYLYPFDASGREELYYIEVYNNADVKQFDREGFPLIEAGGGSTTGYKAHNHIINGQFLYHNLLKADSPYAEGEVRNPVTDVAPNTWTFERPTDSSAEDFILFQRPGSYIDEPPINPRYILNVKCDNPDSGDAIKDLRYKFKDVNFLATQTITVSFWAKSNNSDLNINFDIIKNYGTGADDDETFSENTFTVTNFYKQFMYSFTLASSEGKSIGTQDDDFWQLAFRFPTDEQFDVLLVDFILYEGNVAAPVYPADSPQEVRYKLDERNIVNFTGRMFTSFGSPATNPFKQAIELTDESYQLLKGYYYDDTLVDPLIDYLNSNNINQSPYSFKFEKSPTTLKISTGLATSVDAYTSNATPHITVASTTDLYDMKIFIEKVVDNENSFILTHTENFTPDPTSSNVNITFSSVGVKLNSPIFAIFGDAGNNSLSPPFSLKVLDFGTNSTPAKVKYNFFSGMEGDFYQFQTSYNNINNADQTVNIITYNIKSNNPTPQPAEGIYCIYFDDGYNTWFPKVVPTSPVKKLKIDTTGIVTTKNFIHQMYIQLNNPSEYTFTVASIPTNGKYISIKNKSTFFDIIFWVNGQAKPAAPNPSRHAIYVKYELSISISDMIDLIESSIKKEVAGVPVPAALNLDLKSDLSYYISL